MSRGVENANGTTHLEVGHVLENLVSILGHHGRVFLLLFLREYFTNLVNLALVLVPLVGSHLGPVANGFLLVFCSLGVELGLSLSIDEGLYLFCKLEAVLF